MERMEHIVPVVSRKKEKESARRRKHERKRMLESAEGGAGPDGGAREKEEKKGLPGPTFGSAASPSQAIVDLLPDATVLCDRTGKIVVFNRAAERLFGMKRAGLLGRNVSLLMPSPFREQHDQFLHHYVSTGQRRLMGMSREVPAVRSDGVLFPASLTLAEVDADTAAMFEVPAGCGPPIALATVRDLTETKLKAVLDAPQRYLQEFQELMPLGQGKGGRVFLCRHLLDSQLYGVKQIPLSRQFSPQVVPNAAAGLDDVTSTLSADLHEVMLCAALPPHRNVLRYFSAWIQEVPWEALAFEHELRAAKPTELADAEAVLPYVPPDRHRHDDESSALTDSGRRRRPPPVRPPRRLRASDFRVLSQLGAGAFGQVFLVEHRHTRRKYALKAILRSAIHSKNAWKRVKRERNSMLRASGHASLAVDSSDDHGPGNVDGSSVSKEMDMRQFVVQLHACFHTKLSYYFLMEYAPGGDLATLIDTLGRLAEHVARVYVCELVLALGHLHEHGIIHRDIKPDNVLVAADGHLKLTDFGLAAPLTEDDQLDCDSMVGTLAYVAPEVLTGDGHSFPVDWWSLGVTTYTMLTGVNPWRARDAATLLDAVFRGLPQWPSHAASVTATARRFCTDLLQVEPPRRLGTTGGFRAVQGHSWLRGVRWADVLTSTSPPFVPALENSADVGYFDRAKPVAIDESDANPDQLVAAAGGSRRHRQITKEEKAVSSHATNEDDGDEGGGKENNRHRRWHHRNHRQRQRRQDEQHLTVEPVPLAAAVAATTATPSASSSRCSSPSASFSTSSSGSASAGVSSSLQFSFDADGLGGMASGSSSNRSVHRQLRKLTTSSGGVGGSAAAGNNAGGGDDGAGAGSSSTTTTNHGSSVHLVGDATGATPEKAAGDDGGPAFDEDDAGDQGPTAGLLRRRGAETGVETVKILYLQMQYCPGLSLFKWLAQPDRPCLSMSAALMVLAQVAAGLCHVHAAGVVHRDLKPSNIFISSAEARNLVHRLLRESGEFDELGGGGSSAGGGSRSRRSSSSSRQSTPRRRRSSSIGSASHTPHPHTPPHSGAGSLHRSQPSPSSSASPSPRVVPGEQQGAGEPLTDDPATALRCRIVRETEQLLCHYTPVAVARMTFVIGDFGLAQVTSSGGVPVAGLGAGVPAGAVGSSSGIVAHGARLYAAPELTGDVFGKPKSVASGGAAAATAAGTEADMFSLGMVFAELLLPPDESGGGETASHKRIRRLRKIRARDYGSWLRRMRPDALSLLDALLDPNPSQRIGAADLLRHPQVVPFHSIEQ